MKTGISLIILIIFLASCNFNKNQTSSSDDNDKDSVELQIIVQQLYKWHDVTNKSQDFATTKKGESDSLYSGINWPVHELRVKEIKATGFFHNNFIETYQKMALNIDEELKRGKTTWLVGDLSPFGNDTNPWCNCQDNPDNYLDKIVIKDIKNNKGNVKFNWTWGDGFSYKAEAIKENEMWSISYLEGFDFKDYFNIN